MTASSVLFRTRFLFLVLLLEAALFFCLYPQGQIQKIEPAPIRRSVALKSPPIKEEAENFTVIQKFSFDSEETLKNWEEKVFRGKSLYKIMTEKGRSFLSATSHAASSGLYAKISLAVTPGLCLSWRWRAGEFPVKKRPGELAGRDQDDFAARIYLIFPGSNFFNSNVIEYIWDEHIPVGTFKSSPYSDRVKLVVVRSGKPENPDKAWQKEERDVYKDYELLFGKKPERALGAVALMSDSDNTRTSSSADFGDILFKRREAS